MASEQEAPLPEEAPVGPAAKALALVTIVVMLAGITVLNAIGVYVALNVVGGLDVSIREALAGGLLLVMAK